MAGRGSGARSGDWDLSVVESADIVDNRVSLGGMRCVGVRRGARTEAQLLKPLDILVTARSQAVKTALVPPCVSRTVASATLLVVRTPDPGNGLAHFLWYFLTSRHGRSLVASRLTATSLPTLSARALGEVPVPLPSAATLRRMADLVEANEAAHLAAVEASRVRHDILRDAIIATATPLENR